MKSKDMIDAEFAFSWNRFNLRILGLWPDQTWKESQANLMRIYTPIIWSVWVFILVIVPQILATIAYTFPLGELVEIISIVVGYIAAIMKIIILWYNRDDLVKCLSFLIEDWTRDLTATEHEIMRKNAQLCRKISIGVTILMQSLLWSYVILKAWLLLYLNFEACNATELGRQLFYQSYWPFDLSNPSNFAFIWGGQCIGFFCAAFAYAGTDGFIATLVIHLCGQIAVLRNSIANLIDDETIKSSNTFRTKFRVILKRHQALINSSELIKNAISFLLLLLIIVHTIQLCYPLFHLMISLIERKPGQFPYVSLAYDLTLLNVIFTHIFIYCYVGEMLIEESQALGLMSYSCNWYNLPSTSVKDLQLMICRASIPLQIWAGKFAPISLKLFGSILKTSMSYFSLLLTMKEKLTQ